MRTRASAGFTLLEVMVSVAVLGLIVLGLAEGTRFGLAAWQRQTRQIEARDAIGAADRLIRFLITQADPAGADETPHLRGAPGAMLLWTRLPLAAERAGYGAVEAALGVDGAHRLVLRAAPHPGAERLRMPGPEIEETVLDDVDHLELSYWRAANDGRPGAWLPAWSSPELPRLIRVRLVFPAATGRHWPDIVAAPLLNPADR